jgi:hypothetical protein
LGLSEATPDALDRALALTLERATAAEQWDLVRRVMSELEARRRDRLGDTSLTPKLRSAG